MNNKSYSSAMLGSASTVPTTRKTWNISDLGRDFDKIMSIVSENAKGFEFSSKTSSISSSKQAPCFHIFPDLPVELRLEIWTLVTGQPREVIMDCDQISHHGHIDNASLRTVSPNPAILYVNQESRQVGMAVYKRWSLGEFERQSNSTERVFVNPAVDSVILRMDAGTQKRYEELYYLSGAPAGLAMGILEALFPPTRWLKSEASFPWPKDSAIFSIAFNRSKTNWMEMVLVITAHDGRADKSIQIKDVNAAVKVLQELGVKGYSPGKEADFRGSWTGCWRRFAYV